jgi:hypothetical protein
MTGPEHYAASEAHLDHAASIETDGDEDSMSAWHQRQAQVHATLALAADDELRRKIDRLEVLATATGRELDRLKARLGIDTDAEGDPIAVEPCPCMEQRTAAESAWAARTMT